MDIGVIRTNIISTANISDKATTNHVFEKLKTRLYLQLHAEQKNALKEKKRTHLDSNAFPEVCDTS